jgi:DNA-binding MarR family transcriptional regulator
MREFNCSDTEERQAFFKEKERLWNNKFSEITGSRDLKGIEIFQRLRRTSNIYDMIVNTGLNENEVSGPRLAILITLYVDETMGETDGITPTFLSHVQLVSKNTISSLINGLEAQGLVYRENDVQDRRIFRIKLSEAGRKLVIDRAPYQLDHMNQLASKLSDEEKIQLFDLLGKLLNSLIENSQLKKMNFHENHMK